MRRQKSKLGSEPIDSTSRIDLSDSDTIGEHASELARLIYDVFMEEIAGEEQKKDSQMQINLKTINFNNN